MKIKELGGEGKTPPKPHRPPPMSLKSIDETDVGFKAAPRRVSFNYELLFGIDNSAIFIFIFHSHVNVNRHTATVTCLVH